MTHSHHAGGFSGGVSLMVSLQQYDSHNGSVNIAFRIPSAQHHGGAVGYLFAPTTTTAGHQMGGGLHPGQHHVQFGGASIDGEAAQQGQEHYRSLQGAGFHLLRDLAG